MKHIKLKGVKENNLKNIDIDIPRGAMTVLTGISGSGKSTLAFDTIFAEGQRRYLESLSNYARQFIDRFKKPDLDYISGLSPSVSVDQKTFMRNPRSTVATITEIYDFVRLLYSRLGNIACYKCNNIVEETSLTSILDSLTNDFKNQTIYLIKSLKNIKHYEKKYINMAIETQYLLQKSVESNKLGKEIKVGSI